MAKSQAIDIDRLAREAAKPEFTYMNPSELPIEAGFWNLIIEPRPPKEKVGSIVLAEDTKAADKIQCTVGRIQAIGSLCFKAKTAGGLELEQERIKFKVGDEVLFQRHTGQKIRVLRPSGEERVVVCMSDTEILCLVTDSDRIKFYL